MFEVRDFFDLWNVGEEVVEVKVVVGNFVLERFGLLLMILLLWRV